MIKKEQCPLSSMATGILSRSRPEILQPPCKKQALLHLRFEY